MDVIQRLDLIAINPKVRNGRPYLVGTTLTVADIIIVKIYHRQDADAIAVWFGITLPQVYEALAYYYANQPEMDEQIREQIQRAEALAEGRVGNKNSILPR